MNSQQGKNPSLKTTNCNSSSSNYSTCSDNPDIPSEILSGNLQSDLTLFKIPNRKPHCNRQSVIDIELDNDLVNYSINLLDQNIDALSEDEFMDCQDLTKSDAINDDSTQYLEIQMESNIKENNNSSKFQKLGKDYEISTFKKNILPPLILFEKERSATAVKNVKCANIIDMPGGQKHVECMKLKRLIEDGRCANIPGPSKPTTLSNTGDMVVEMIEHYKNHDKVYNNKKNTNKKVVFSNKNYIFDDVQECETDNTKNKKQEQNTTSVNSKQSQKTKVIDENCNYHNTTDSFVLWEKICESSETLSSKRSLSFTDLSSLNHYYKGDDEDSSVLKTLDESLIYNYSLHKTVTNSSRNRCLRRKSKSCESLLQEVKHLPHFLYDRFLKCLSKEINNIRKQNVVCTCDKYKKKSYNKDNNRKIVKQNTYQSTKTTLKESNEKIRIPTKSVASQTRLSPEVVLTNSTHNGQGHSPKSPITPISARKQSLYSWRKEIVSPVGEYIRGKRPSPFKNSPNKKKL